MQISTEYHAPSAIEFSADLDKGPFALKLVLHEHRKDKPTQCVDMDKFKTAYSTRKKSMHPGLKKRETAEPYKASLTSSCLVDLMYGRVTLDMPVSGDSSAFFAGIGEGIGKIDFRPVRDKSAPAIVITWK